jgi:hypothetical protein
VLRVEMTRWHHARMRTSMGRSRHGRATLGHGVPLLCPHAWRPIVANTRLERTLLCIGRP